ncbi:hypothetical protein AB6A40_007035 [Gnathostoma spinigerum]|uniref:Uncharacterized protein n=1 Tax=Gnathostoma spinigerum TaxID=75299 RepID=A0ABD6EM32_9BILA
MAKKRWQKNRTVKTLKSGNRGNAEGNGRKAVKKGDDGQANTLRAIPFLWMKESTRMRSHVLSKCGETCKRRIALLTDE